MHLATQASRLAAPLLAAALSSTALAQTCPTNTMSNGCCYDAVVNTSTAPSYSYVGPWQAGTSCELACYDLPHGALVVNVPESACFCDSYVQAVDRFHVEGIPPSGPISFAARLHVTGYLPTMAFGLAGLQETGGARVEKPYSETDSPLDITLTLPLSKSVGETFELAGDMRVAKSVPYAPAVVSPNAARPAAASEVSGTLEFLGLPPGAVVQSCQGYGLPVPVLPSSWGRLKAAYR